MSWSKSEMQAIIYPLDSPINSIVEVPGSKSYTNRASIIAALAKGVSTLYNCSDSEDSLLMITILKKLGVKIISAGNEIKIYGNSEKFKEFKGTIDVKDAGTVMRFLIALCCLIPGEIILKGTKRMQQRPIKGLVDALIQLGADITYMAETGFPPLKIKGGKLQGGKIKMDASESSQFVSALLMIAPILDSELNIAITGETASRPYIDMTVDVMQYFGVTVKNTEHLNFIVKHQQEYQSTDYTIETDASCATYFSGIAAITKSTIRVTNLSPLSRQGDIRFADLLMEMGCKVKMDADRNYIEVTGVEELKPIEVDMRDMPDAAPALAVVASFAKGTSIIRGLKNLELKESKRLTSLKKELTRMGIICHSDGEQLTIEGGNPSGALFHTYNDHRIAMAFAMAGTKIKDVIIQSPMVVFKSFPRFWHVLQDIGTKIDFTIEAFENISNIFLIGFMGSGKSTIGKLLADKFDRPFYETDNIILKQSGFKSVNEIFDKEGENFFRENEKKAVYKCAAKYASIISCGGGVVGDPENMKILKQNGKIIYLSASLKTIRERLKGDESRPLFKDLKNAKKLYSQRLSLYKKYADMIIFTDKMTPDEVITNIISLANFHDKNAGGR